MADIAETPLPGVGVRYDLTTAEGDRLGVIAQRSGRYELLVYDPRDPDACRARVRLDRSDAHALVDLLGGSRIVERLGSLRQHLTGLALDWISIPDSSPARGRTIAETELRGATGASVVAIIRGDTTVTAPGPDDRIEAGDVVVVVGTDDGISAASERLRG
jgi:TrkA domain protein